MSNETKRDVFEELLEAYDDAKSSDGNLHPTQELLDYDDRYANALPDDLPVLPKVWGDTIEEFKANHYKLSELFNEWDLNYDEQKLIARVWLDGYQIEEAD